MDERERRGHDRRRHLGAAGLLVVALAASRPAVAFQASGCCTLTGGGELANAVVWRGVEYTPVPALQPWIAAEWGPASVEGAVAGAVDGSWAEEDVTAALRIASLAGTAELRLTAYMFPRASQDFASPVTELGVQYTTSSRYPVRVLLTRNVGHDPDAASQAELGVGRAWPGLAAELFAGVALNRSAYYRAAAGDMLQVGAAVARTFHPAPAVALTAGLAGVYRPPDRRGWLLAHLGVELPFGAPPDAPRRSSLTRRL
ncbi:MAG: hypothetical protein KGN74_03755 [Gemmatimonadota bacterium]|nr:hypothetical protein [Gemmatimonadota bacterium]